jgi:hypothetical protein
MEIEQIYIENITYILIVVFILITIILLIHLFNIDLNEIYPKKLLQVVTIESLENNNISNTKNKKFTDVLNNEPLLLTPKDFINTDLAKDFCKSFQGSGQKLEKQCNSLTKTNCNLTSCCVLLNGEKCVAGSEKGPTFLTNSDGSTIHNEFYYYQHKKSSSKL